MKLIFIPILFLLALSACSDTETASEAGKSATATGSSPEQLYNEAKDLF